MSLAIRPSFTVELTCTGRVALERLCAALAVGPHRLRRTQMFGGGGDAAARDHDHFVLTVAEAEQRLYSPWLTVEVSPRPSGAEVFARFSPHPSVWTFFAFAYLALSAVLLFSLCFAASQKMTGAPPHALWITGGAAVAMVLLFAAAQLGQRLANAQMAALRAALDQALAQVCAPPAP